MDRVLKRADPSTIQDKFLVGYQGWFSCAGDGEPIDPGHHGWLHWFDRPIPNGGRPNTDLWPDVSEYSTSELYPTPGISFQSGEPATLFSSRHPKTVQRHFHWMARHGVDGVFLQRFLGQCDLEGGSGGVLRLRDEIGDRVQEAAEKEGRVFAIMYDVSGVAPDKVMKILTRDWLHLIREKRVLDSPNYLKERRMPVVALWGFGFDNRNHTPELVREVTHFIREVTPGGAYIMAGTPTHWRRAVEDADRNPAFLDVWLSEFDAISPWMVGRLSTELDADNFAERFMKADIELLKKEGKRKIDYIPVVYPGFSGLNLSEGNWGFNQIKRNGGKFLWQQVFNAKRLGLRVMYGAMWDEYDEGTALMPVVEKSRMLPRSEKYNFLALDADGYDLPADWYMRICGFAAEGLRSERQIHETFPSKELQDYWSTRPHYEEVNAKSGDFVSGSGNQGGEGGNSYQAWLALQKDGKDELPPPPYSLEAEETASGSSQRASSSQLPMDTPVVALSPSSPQRASSSQLLMSAPVAALSSDFSRQSLSSSPPLNTTPTSVTRPPIHPSHPGRTSSGTPNGVGSSSSISPPPVHPSRPRPPEPNRLSRPQSVSASRPQTTHTTAGPSPNQRPPSSAPSPSPQPPLNRLGRDQTNTPSLPPTTSSLRPTSPYDPRNHRPPLTGGSSIRPVTPQHPMSFPEASVPAPSNHHPASVVAASPPGSPSLGGPSFPSGPYGPTPTHQFQPSGPNSYYGPTSSQPPRIPYPSHPSSYFGPNPSHPYSETSSNYPGMMSPQHDPSGGGVSMGPYGPPSHLGMGGGHHNYNPPPGPPPGMGGGRPSYNPPPGPPPSQQFQHMPSYPSDSSSYNNPGTWSSPPPIPPRNNSDPYYAPQNQPYYAGGNSYPQQQMPSSSSSGSLTNYARNAVDKVAGQETRQQLEQKLGSLAHSSSKLLGKFTK